MNKNKLNITRENFTDFVIAQDDDKDYEESGYVAVVQGKNAAIGRYSHCSCFGTWTSLTGGGIFDSGSNGGELSWSWTGTVKGLVKLAKDMADPTLPSRKADAEDYDYDHLVKVYSQILEWDKKNKEEL